MSNGRKKQIAVNGKTILSRRFVIIEFYLIYYVGKDLLSAKDLPDNRAVGYLYNGSVIMDWMLIVMILGALGTAFFYINLVPTAKNT